MGLANGDIETINGWVSKAKNAELERAAPSGGNPSNLVPLTATHVADIAAARKANWPSINHPRKGDSTPGNWQSWRRHYQPVPGNPGLTLSAAQVQAVVRRMERELRERALAEERARAEAEDIVVP
jgi:hypothetical protein